MRVTATKARGKWTLLSPRFNSLIMTSPQPDGAANPPHLAAGPTVHPTLTTGAADRMSGGHRAPSLPVAWPGLHSRASPQSSGQA